MNKLIFKILVASALLLTSSWAWAQSASGSSGMAQTMGYASAGVATVMGGMMIKKGCAASPGDSMECMMGVMAVMQGLSTAASAAGDGGTTGDVSSTDCTSSTSFNCMPGASGNTTTTGGPGTGGTGGGYGGLPANAQQALSQLAGQGYTYNPGDNSVTTPTGTYPASSFGSGATLAASGAVSADEGKKLDAAIKDALKNAVVSVPLAGGGGGGAGGGGTKIEYTDDNAGKRGLNIGKPKTAGLTRTLASGESIGSQVDDIFRMITSKYREKSGEKDYFLGK